MEGRNMLRFFLLLLVVSLFFLLSRLNLPYHSLPSNRSDVLTDCSSSTSSSPWCTTTSKRPHFLTKPTHHHQRSPDKQHDHSTDNPHHPLDPLTVQELNKVRDIISSHRLFKSMPFVLHLVVLEEPAKEVVVKWRKGDPLFPRKASVIARVGGKWHVATVEVDSGRVIVRDDDVVMGGVSGYPTMSIEEMAAVTVAPLASVEFNRTVVERGVDLKDLACLALSSGWYGQDIEEKRRLIKVQCFSMKDTSNFYMRPIEGLTVTIDLDTQGVVEISDRGKDIPIPGAANTEYRYSALRKEIHKLKLTNPISLEQPKGPSFTVEDNHLVQWANWEFHLKPDPRAGVIISRAMFKDPDSGEMRSVMYKGMTSELFVPYMDPTDAWYFKTYMDAGEYGFGLQSMPLEPLNDCPRSAYYMDGVFSAGDGRPYVRENMVCVFERYAGDIGWRHSECPITGMDIREVRPKVTLVVRMAASVANYDYIVDWEFQTDGLIRIKESLVGGTDTVVTSIQWIMTELLNHPEMMIKVQQELIEVVGPNNNVEESHVFQLPYLEAVIMETFRLHPPVAFPFPREPSSDAIVGGYLIPRGTRVIINIWAMHRDPIYWEDPLEFRPERFLNNNGDGKHDFSGISLQFLPFGSGRRTCPGISLAQRMTRLTVASFVHSFDWKLPEGIDKLDTKEHFSPVLSKQEPVIVIPSLRLSNLKLYEM